MWTTKTPGVLKPRKVHLVSKTKDTSMHGGLPTLRCFKRTTAGKKLDDILEAEKELLPQLEPEPAGTETRAEDYHTSNNMGGIKVMQDTEMINCLCSNPLTSPEKGSTKN